MSRPRIDRGAGAALALAVALGGCLRATPSDTPPPPRGKTLDEYLADPEAERPRRPADTVPGDAMALHVIDVGQGAAQLIELPCGAILIDTGGERNRLYDSEPALIRYLDGFFERRPDLDRTLSLLVITHPHIDHTRGVAAVLARYRVLNVVDNGDVREDIGGKPQLAMHEWLVRNRQVGHLDLNRSEIDPATGATSPIIDPVAGCARSQVDPVVRALWSGDLGREQIGHDPNDDSVVMRIDFGEVSFLLAGDIELYGIAGLVKKYGAHPELLDADVYVVPHHGSRHSTTADLVRRVSPKVAVISAGPYARRTGERQEFTARAFGHPSQASIDDLLQPRVGVAMLRPRPVTVWLGQRGAWEGGTGQFARRTLRAAIYATSWDGTVVVTGNANGWIDVATRR